MSATKKALLIGFLLLAMPLITVNTLNISLIKNSNGNWLSQQSKPPENTIVKPDVVLSIPYDAYFENITLFGSLVVMGGSSVKVKNLYLQTGYYPNIVAIEGSSIEIENINLIGLPNYTGLSISSIDSSITISGISGVNLSVYVNAYGSSFIRFYNINSTFFSVNAYNSTHVFVTNISSNYVNLWVESNSFIHLFGEVNILNGYFSGIQNAFMEIRNAFLQNLIVNSWDDATFRATNTLVNGTLRLDQHDRSTSYFDNVSRNSTIDINLWDQLTSTELYSSNVSTIYVSPFDYLSPYDITLNSVRAYNSSIETLNLGTPNLVLLNNTNVSSASLPFVIWGTGSIQGGSILPGPDGIGPYPVELVGSSTITTIFNTSNLFIVNFTGDVLDSDLGLYYPLVYAIMSQFTMFNVTSSSTLFLIDSYVTILNSSVQYFNSANSTIDYRDSTLSTYTSYSASGSVFNTFNVTFTQSFYATFYESNLNFTSTVFNDYFSISIEDSEFVAMSSQSLVGDLYLNYGNVSLIDSNFTGVSISGSGFWGTWLNLSNSTVGYIEYAVNVTNGFVEFNNTEIISGSGYLTNLQMDNLSTVDNYALTFFHSENSNVIFNNSNLGTVDFVAYIDILDTTISMYNSFSYAILNLHNSTLFANNTMFTEDIYLMQSTIDANNSQLESIFAGNGSSFNLINDTVTSIETYFADMLPDFLNTYINGSISGSTVSQVTLSAIGHLNITYSSIGLMLAAFTNAMVNYSSIDLLINVSHVTLGTATIINNVTNGFDGSYTIVDPFTSILGVVNGFVAFDSNVTVENSTIVGFIAFGASNITFNNVIGYPDFYSMFLFDVSFLNATNFSMIPSGLGDYIAFFNDSSFGEFSDSTVNIPFTLMSSTSLFVSSTVLNSTIMMYGPFSSFTATTGSTIFVLNAFGEVYVSVNDSKLTNLSIYGGSGSATLSNVTYLSSTLILANVTGFIEFNSPASTPLTLFNVSSSDLSIFNVTFSGGGSFYAYQSTIHVFNSLLYQVFINDTSFITHDTNITLLFSAMSTVHLYGGNVSYGTGVFYGSSLTAHGTYIQQAAVGGGSQFTLLNGTINMISEYLFIKQIETMIAFGIPSQGNTLRLINSTITSPFELTPLTVTGGGIFSIDNWTTASWGSTIVTNLTDTIFDSSLQPTAGYHVLSIYIDGTAKSEIYNLNAMEGNGLLFATVNTTTDTQAPTATANVTTLTAEFGAIVPGIQFTSTDDSVIISYRVLLNGTEIESGEVNDVTHLLEFDPNIYLTSEGTYIFEYEAYDADGNRGTVTVTITVTPSIPPIITQNPSGTIEFELGMIPSNVTWVITDDSPDTYTIFINGTPVQSGSYTSGEIIEFDTASQITNPGTYNVTILATDKAENTAKGEIIVKAYPSQAPSITSAPNNATINVSQSIVLNWTAEDRFPDTYTIYVNGTAVVSDQPWTSGDKISYTFSQSSAGVYEVKIVFKDKAGNTSENTVYITVLEEEIPGPGGGPGIPISTTIIVSFIIVLSALVVVISVFRRRR